MPLTLRRFRWMMLARCRPTVERLALLACFFCVGIIVLSWVAYERNADTASHVEQRRRRQKQFGDEYIQRLQDVEERHQKESRNDERFGERDERVVDEKRQEEFAKNEGGKGDLGFEEKLKRKGDIRRKQEDEYDEENVQQRHGNVRGEGVRGKQRENVDSEIEDSMIGNNSGLIQRKFNLNLNDEQSLRFKKNENAKIIVHTQEIAALTHRGTKKEQKPSTTSQGDMSTKIEDLLGPLSGGEANVKVYSTKSEVAEKFDCIKLNIKPYTFVCLYDNSEDVHVSQHLRNDLLWEPHILRLFQNYLFQNPDVGVYDIGSHVGQYSLLAAVMGHKVVAVDPYLPNLRRLHKAIVMNNVRDKVIVVQNAVSNQHDTFELFVPSDNQGGVSLIDQDADRFCDGPSCPPHAQTILMDDLLEVTNFKSAIIKIDIEGHEHHAFARSEKLFRAVHITYIFMEWMKLRGYYGSEAEDTEDKRLVFELIEMLIARGYTARGCVLLNVLDVKYWYGWPDDIVWQHKDATRV